MFFVDGLGLGSPDPAVNPVQAEVCPRLVELLESARPVDACLGVDGLPQSATGQTALLTGVNAARLMGRHIEGFPGRRLVEIVSTHNIFRMLKEMGLSATFANGYFVADSTEAAASQPKSVTTVATLSSFGEVRNKADIECGQAVYQDLTRETLRARGYKGALITPELAALHLLDIAGKHRFTLFEYFQTDRAGHRGDFEVARRVLRKFDLFLDAIMNEVTNRGDLSLVLTSDHGNIEDLGTIGHTLNPVPFAVAGPGACELKNRVASLLDVTPAIVETLIR